MITDYTANMWVDTVTNLDLNDPTPKNGEIIFGTTGTHIVIFAIGNNSLSWSNLKKFWFDFFNGRFGIGRDPVAPLDIYRATGINDIVFATGDASEVRVALTNTAGDWELRNGTSGIFYLHDDGNVKNPFVVENNCDTNLLYLDNAGRVEIGGALGVGSGGRVTLTTGTYNGYDVQDVGYILLNPSGGNITINDFTNGVAGQAILVNRGDTANTVTITRASGSNQDFRTYTELDIVSTVPFADVWQFNGTVWVVGGGTQ